MITENLSGTGLSFREEIEYNVDEEPSITKSHKGTDGKLAVSNRYMGQVDMSDRKKNCEDVPRHFEGVFHGNYPGALGSFRGVLGVVFATRRDTRNLERSRGSLMSLSCDLLSLSHLIAAAKRTEKVLLWRFERGF